MILNEKGDKPWLLGRTLPELAGIVKDLGLPEYTARQISSWLYTKGVGDIGDMTDISLKNRLLLGATYTVGGFAPAGAEESTDGTKKYLFPTLGGGFIESAYIPDGDRATLCVSSQAGCRMGCEFCMTGKQGLQHDLTSGEIINQLRSIPEYEKVTNIVYMGMGEPLNNLEEVISSLEILTSPWGYAWSPTRITVSTIGMLSGLRSLIERTRVHIAVSLHNPFGEQREKIMPVEKAFPIAEIVKLLKQYDFTRQRRVSFEYILMEGLNDSAAHIKELARLLNGLKCRINLIRFHRIPGSPFVSPEADAMVKFRDALTAKGIMTTIRASRGEDIKAACGLLSTGHKV